MAKVKKKTAKKQEAKKVGFYPKVKSTKRNGMGAS